MIERPPVLELERIAKSYGGVSALRGVDFTLRAGEIHGLVGENGAGKTTLMKIIAGVETGFQGAFRMDGGLIRFHSPHDAIAAGIGMVHQELSIAPDLSVAENVFLGRQPVTWFGTIDWRKMAVDAQAELSSLGLAVDPRARIGSLSLGLQQSIELGRILFSGARVIILDEPTSALSPPETEQLFGALRRLAAAGRSVVFISHFLDDIAAISHRLTVLREGSSVASVDTRSVDKSWIIRRMIGTGKGVGVGTDAVEVKLKLKPEGEPVLSADRLQGGTVRDVSLEVASGEVLGVYGFMGSGHSDLGQLFVGKEPARGIVRLAGRRLHHSNTAQAKRAGLVCLPESRRHMLFAAQPVYKNISIGILEKLSRLLLRPAAERRIAVERIAELDVRPRSVERMVGAFSGGNQQKVALARWLTHLPKALVLNEPTRGMDIGAKRDVVAIIRNLREQGVAIIVTSTEPETILAVADRVIVMKRGRVAREFSGEVVGKDHLLASAA